MMLCWRLWDLSKQEQNDQRAAAVGEFLEKVPTLTDIYCSQLLRPFKLEFLPVLICAQSDRNPPATQLAIPNMHM